MISALSLGSASAYGSCMRIVPPDPKAPHDLDGPGFFSPLEDTVSLGCFRFKGISGSGKSIVALLEDERGKSYRLKRGDLIGENGGHITEITAKRISISQLVVDANGKWVETPRYLFREVK